MGLKSKLVNVFCKKKPPNSWKLLKSQFNLINSSEGAAIRVNNWPASEEVALASLKLVIDSPYSAIEYSSQETFRDIHQPRSPSIISLLDKDINCLSVLDVGKYKELITNDALSEQDFFAPRDGVRLAKVLDPRSVIASNYNAVEVEIVSNRPMFQNRAKDANNLLFFCLKSNGDHALTYNIDGLDGPFVSNRKYFVNKSRVEILGFLRVKLPYQFRVNKNGDFD